MRLHVHCQWVDITTSRVVARAFLRCGSAVGEENYLRHFATDIRLRLRTERRDMDVDIICGKIWYIFSHGEATNM